MLGIDPATGTQKFNVPLPIGQPIVTPYSNCPSGNDVGYGYSQQPGQLIVAGDGNAYVLYAYNEFVNECGIQATHLRLLQVSSSGASNLLTIMDRQAPTDLASYQASSLQAGIIANADTGVVLTWGQYFSADSAFGPTQYGMAITTGASVAIVNAPSVPGQPVLGTAMSPVFPVLQAEDGSFFGSYQTNMVAFDQAGSIRWIVPNEYPLMATPDGGVTGQSGITYDQNGNATGQTSLSTQSWRGAMYQAGPLVIQVALPAVILAQSLWAQVGGNPAGFKTAGRPWFFMLFWQNNCSSSPQPCGFILIPDDPAENLNLQVDATSQAAAIKSAALAALKKAYDKYPVTVGEVSKPTDGDHRANVVDGQDSDGHGTQYCGETTPVRPNHDSKVFYWINMEYAQWALPITLITPADVSNALQNANLMKAIGAGIGNTGAHELAHQFLLDTFGMEDSSSNTYNGVECRGWLAPWLYGVGAIGWEPMTADALKAALGAGWRLHEIYP